MKKITWRQSLKMAIPMVVLGLIIFTTKLSRIPVATHRVELGSIVGEVMGTGTLGAHIGATISPKIQGRLTEVLADQNERVKEGQILARLEDAEWKEQVAVASAGLDTAIATVERTKAERSRAQAILAQARLGYDRSLDLSKSGVTSQADLDQSVERLHVAEADPKGTEAAITEAERQRLAAEKNLALHRARLADTIILSPFDALVVRRDRDPGDSVVPGSSVLEVISSNEIWISAWVDETAMSQLAVGQKARAVFRSEPSVGYTAEVARLGRQVDRETREFVVDVRLANLPSNWAVGQRAEVFIETTHRASMLGIPREYVIWREGKPGAFVNVAGKARWRNLTLGVQDAAIVEVLEGLQEGDEALKSITGKSSALREGKRIKKS